MMAKKKLNTAGMIGDAASAIEPTEVTSDAPSKATKAPVLPQKRKRDATEQLNIRVSEGLGKDLKIWAIAHDINPADIIEQGFELMKAKYGA